MSTTSATGFSVRVILSLALLSLAIGVAWVSVKNHQPAPVDVDVSQQRLANKADYQKTNTELLFSYGIADKEKSLYRIPLEQARAKALLELKNFQRKN